MTTKSAAATAITVARALPPSPAWSRASGFQRKAQGDVVVVQRICEGAVGVAADGLQALDHLLGRDRRLKAFEQQGCPGAFLGGWVTPLPQRQDNQQLAVALLEVGIERAQHRRRQTGVRCAAVDQRFAPSEDGFAQAAHGADQAGALVHHLDPADGFDRRPPATPNGYAEAIAAHELPGLVGNAEGDLGGMETGMDAPGEGVQLLPQLFAVSLVLLPLDQIDRGQVGHAHQELHLSGHGQGAVGRRLPDFDHGGDLSIQHNRRGEDGPGKGVLT